MDDPNITMEEYIRLEEQKARRHGRVFNWETFTYGKIWYDEDLHDLRSIETEFPAIVFDDAFTSEVTYSCEPTPTVSCLNDLDFFKDFENEFPAIVYNDALTSKSDFSTEPTVYKDNDDGKIDIKHQINYHDYDDKEYENETQKEGHELCEVPVCQIKRYEMIKYSFNYEEEYVAVKEDEYDDFTNTGEEACRSYQEIFRMMDEGWKVTRTME
ncbi:hypothetical protein Tco_0370374 [Tanacetum coccineum]